MILFKILCSWTLKFLSRVLGNDSSALSHIWAALPLVCGSMKPKSHVQSFHLLTCRGRASSTAANMRMKLKDELPLPVTDRASLAIQKEQTCHLLGACSAEVKLRPVPPHNAVNKQLLAVSSPSSKLVPCLPPIDC